MYIWVRRTEVRQNVRREACAKHIGSQMSKFVISYPHSVHRESGTSFYRFGPMAQHKFKQVTDRLVCRLYTGRQADSLTSRRPDKRAHVIELVQLGIHGRE